MPCGVSCCCSLLSETTVTPFSFSAAAEASTGAGSFAGGTEKDYKDYNFLYPNLEVSISLYTKTGVYRMNGVYTYDE